MEPILQTLRNHIIRAFFGQFPTLYPVQSQAIGPLKAGFDALLLSPTASGKTEAALAPIIDRWYDVARTAEGTTILYVCPTRALINDLVARLTPPMDALGLTVGVRHGDRSDLGRRESPDLLITTPESLDVLLCKKEKALRDVQVVIFDEVHLLYNSQRGFQLGALLGRLERLCGRRLQVVGLSATVSNPQDLAKFLFGEDQRLGLTVIEGGPSRPIQGHVRRLLGSDDFCGLIRRMMQAGPAKLLLFADSRRQCDGLATQLKDGGIPSTDVYVHYSSLSRESREQVEQEFARNPNGVCIATSTLELGIDIGDIDAVILYGAPAGWESFLQRIGRGNRRLNRTSVVGLVPPDSKHAALESLAFLSLLRRAQAGQLQRESAFCLYGAALQQILSCLLEKRGGFVGPSEVGELFSAYGHVNREAIESMMETLSEGGILIRHGFKRLYGAGEGFHRLASLRLLHGNFPARSREVKVWEGNREIGTVPVTNLIRVAPGSRVRFAGRIWEVQQVRPDQIDVRPARGKGPAIDFLYPGKGPSMDPATLEDVFSLIESGEIDHRVLLARDADWLTGRIQQLQPYVKGGGVPSVRSDGGFYYLTFGGFLLNQAITLSVEERTQAIDDVSLRVRMPISFSELPEAPEKFGPSVVDLLDLSKEATIFQSLLPAHLARREMAEVWLKTPAHERTLARLRQSSSRSCDSGAVVGF